VEDKAVFFVNAGATWYFQNTWSESQSQSQSENQRKSQGKNKDGDGSCSSNDDESAEDTNINNTTCRYRYRYRQILFEIKQPPKYDQEQVDHMLQTSRQLGFSPDVGTELLLDNKFCRVWDFYLEPGEGGGPEFIHHHTMDYVFMLVADSRLLGYHHDGRPGLFDSINKNNDVLWTFIPPNAFLNPQEFAHGGKNGYEDRPLREYLVELK